VDVPEYFCRKITSLIFLVLASYFFNYDILNIKLFDMFKMTGL